MQPEQGDRSRIGLRGLVLWLAVGTLLWYRLIGWPPPALPPLPTALPSGAMVDVWLRSPLATDWTGFVAVIGLVGWAFWAWAWTSVLLEVGVNLIDAATHHAAWVIGMRSVLRPLTVPFIRRIVDTSPPTQGIGVDAGERWYTVQRGDTLSGICARLLGDPARTSEVFELNSGAEAPDGHILRDPNLIWPGVRLRLPLDGQGAAQEADEPPVEATPTASPAAPPATASPAPSITVAPTRRRYKVPQHPRRWRPLQQASKHRQRLKQSPPSNLGSRCPPPPANRCRPR